MYRVKISPVLHVITPQNWQPGISPTWRLQLLSLIRMTPSAAGQPAFRAIGMAHAIFIAMVRTTRMKPGNSKGYVYISGDWAPSEGYPFLGSLHFEALCIEQV